MTRHCVRERGVLGAQHGRSVDQGMCATYIYTACSDSDRLVPASQCHAEGVLDPGDGERAISLAQGSGVGDETGERGCRWRHDGPYDCADNLREALPALVRSITLPQMARYKELRKKLEQEIASGLYRV